MSDKPADAGQAKPAGKKKLVLIGAIVAVLVVGAAAAWFLLARGHGAEGEEGAPAPQHKAAAPKGPPTFLPIENMVVNLADPGGDRFAQLGLTLELADSKTAEQVKQFLPAIRSAILVLVSQRTSDELLTKEGKEKLAQDILREVSKPLGFKVPKKKKRKDPEDEEDDEGDEPRPSSNPVRGVLFSSFIIQ